MTEHEVKSWKYLFEPIWDGRKTHDLRIMDRGYQVGDILNLKEYDTDTNTYTGRFIKAEITYITGGEHVKCAFSPFVLLNEYGILSLRRFAKGGLNNGVAWSDVI